MQLPARSPALTAMTAATLSNLSGGRFVLGLGPSGPQVVEGWHGVAYGKPLTRLREYVSIVRSALARRAPLTADGEYYHLPYDGPGASGLGKALRLNTKPEHAVPIYTSAMGPAALATGAEIGDGVIATLVDANRLADVEAALDRGFAVSGRRREDFTLVAHVSVVRGDDVAACFDRIRPFFARTIGGYGARGRNFYLDQVSRSGWASEAAKVQELYLAGRRDEAVAAVPDEMLDAYSLVGPPERIAERARRYQGVDILMLGTADEYTLQAIAGLAGGGA
jgi:F420-dependent oxidoreductase-like protein